MKKQLYKFLLLTIIILVVGLITLTSHLASMGEKTRLLDQESYALEEENRDLRLLIASNSALSTIEAKSTELGLANISDKKITIDLSTIAFKP